MMRGVPLHTHAKVEGVQGVRVLKLLDGDEAPALTLSPALTSVAPNQDVWLGANGVQISQPRDPQVLAAGDVVRLREGSSLVSVVWRRGARTNSLFATERCNSLCLMCSQPPRAEDDSWRIAEMLATIPLIDPDAEQLGVTGGEPTLLGSGLTEVLTRCGELLPSTRLHVLTNGRNFSDGEAAASWITAGGQRTTWAVPLYADLPALHDEVVGSEGAFDETIEGLVELALNNARVELRVVLHRLTVPRLNQLVSFIYRRLPFVEHVALMGLEPMGFAKLNRDRLWIDPIDYAADLREAVFYLANRSIPVSIYNVPLCTLPRSLWTFARQSISEWKNTYVPACTGCAVQKHCSGFFSSAGAGWLSRAINPIPLEEAADELA